MFNYVPTGKYKYLKYLVILIGIVAVLVILDIIKLPLKNMDKNSEVRFLMWIDAFVIITYRLAPYRKKYLFLAYILNIMLGIILFHSCF